MCCLAKLNEYHFYILYILFVWMDKFTFNIQNGWFSFNVLLYK